MKVPVNVKVEFRRIPKQGGGLGKGHIVVNGVSLCPPHTWPWGRDDEVQRITLADFAKKPCLNCEGLLNEDKSPGLT